MVKDLSESYSKEKVRIALIDLGHFFFAILLLILQEFLLLYLHLFSFNHNGEISKIKQNI
ncbi:hypothetical protein CEH05_16835 [Halobacillus halophilus]|nr:hypothetical protein CEH05_16835 [Halobacillus halophilus]